MTGYIDGDLADADETTAPPPTDWLPAIRLDGQIVRSHRGFPLKLCASVDGYPSLYSDHRRWPAIVLPRQVQNVYDVCAAFDEDLAASIRAAIAGYLGPADAGIVLRDRGAPIAFIPVTPSTVVTPTVENAWTLANVIDAAVAEQDRRSARR